MNVCSLLPTPDFRNTMRIFGTNHLLAALLTLFLTSCCSTPATDGGKPKEIFDRVQLGMKRYEVLVILGPPRLAGQNDVYYLPPRRPLRQYESPQAPARILIRYDQNDNVVHKEFFK